MLRHIYFLGCLLIGCSSQSQKPLTVNWCTTSYADHSTCQQLKMDMTVDPSLDGSVPVSQGTQRFLVSLECVQGKHAYDCVETVVRGNAHVVRLTAEQIYAVQALNISAHASLVVVAAGQTIEHCPFGCKKYSREYSVAVVRKATMVKQLADMKSRKICMSKEGSLGGWVIPISKMYGNWTDQNRRTFGRIRRQIWANPQDEFRYTCPSDYNVLYDLFAQTCSPGQWWADNKFNEQYGDRMCQLCSQNCSTGYSQSVNSPLECLTSGKGDVAFVSSRDIDTVFVPKVAEKSSKKMPTEAQGLGLVCSDGLTDIISEYQSCNWGNIPSDAYLSTSKYDTSGEVSTKIIAGFIKDLYARINNNRERYPRTKDFVAETGLVIKITSDPKTADSTTPTTYLQQAGDPSFMKAMTNGFPSCPGKDKMRLCVTNMDEALKCEHMQLAFASAAMPNILDCILGFSEDNCIQMINSSKADMAMVATHRADEYMHSGTIMPLLEEKYGEHGVYALAVVIKKDLQGLKDLSSGMLGVCSSGTDSFSGWEAPNKVFKDLKMIDKNEVRLTEAWVKMLKPQSSCVPGATSDKVTLGRSSPDCFNYFVQNPLDNTTVGDLCAQCSPGPGNCKTPAQAQDSNRTDYDLYYGGVGALRCLARRHGDVAFVSSTAVHTIEYINDPDFRGLRPEDFSLLCSDGISVLPFSEENEKICNLGKSPDRWMVIGSSIDKKQMKRWQDVWIIALNRARKEYDWLRTYLAVQPGTMQFHNDLIFSNNTVGMRRFWLNSSQEWLHNRAYEEWDDPFQCPNHSHKLTQISFTLLIVLTAAVKLLL